MIHKPHTSERKLGNSGRMCVFQPLYVRHWMFSPLTWSQFCATWYQCYLKLSKPSLHLVLCLPLFYVCPLCQCPEGEAGCPAVVCSSCSLSILLMSMRQVCLFLFKTELFLCWFFVLHSFHEEAYGNTLSVDSCPCSSFSASKTPLLWNTLKTLTAQALIKLFLFYTSSSNTLHHSTYLWIQRTVDLYASMLQLNKPTSLRSDLESSKL